MVLSRRLLPASQAGAGALQSRFHPILSGCVGKSNRNPRVCGRHSTPSPDGLFWPVPLSRAPRRRSPLPADAGEAPGPRQDHQLAGCGVPHFPLLPVGLRAHPPGGDAFPRCAAPRALRHLSLRAPSLFAAGGRGLGETVPAFMWPLPRTPPGRPLLCETPARTGRPAWTPERWPWGPFPRRPRVLRPRSSCRRGRAPARPTSPRAPRPVRAPSTRPAAGRQLPPGPRQVSHPLLPPAHSRVEPTHVHLKEYEVKGAPKRFWGGNSEQQQQCAKLCSPR